MLCDDRCDDVMFYEEMPLSTDLLRVELHIAQLNTSTVPPIFFTIYIGISRNQKQRQSQIFTSLFSEMI